MALNQPTILVTGASGQLGQLAVEALLRRRPPSDIAALVRRREAGEALAAKGVEIRVGDYSEPGTLDAALTGIERLLLVSSSEVGQRGPQHRNVIEAASRAGVKLIAYTSILHADRSSLALAAEHRETEALLEQSGIPYVLLRNGWYTENFVPAIKGAAGNGSLARASGEGRVSTATRADYAAAAAAALLGDITQVGTINELAGDTSFSLPELAEEVARVTGRPVDYRNVSEAEFKAALVSAGLPDGYAGILADADRGTEAGDLEDDSRTLSRLIGRATTPWQDTVRDALAS